MKQLVSRSISAAAMLGLLACSPQSAQLQQCKTVVNDYIQLHAFSAEDVFTEGAIGRISLSFSVKSALGLQRGQAHCEYAVSDSGQFAETPFAITLGDSRYTAKQDIKDLLAGRYADGLPADLPH